MKKLIAPLAVATVVIATSMLGCKMPKKLTTDQIQAIEDSIPHIFPTATMIHTNQNEDNDKVNLIITDPTFYISTPEQKQAAAIRSGVMLIHVMGADNNLSKATLVITKDKSTNDGIPADGIQTDMKIDSLVKAGVK